MSEIKEDKCCRNEKTTSSKFVKATDLPLHGNPYPISEDIKPESPGFLEVKIHGIRSSIQPYLNPIVNGFIKVKDITSIGYAHTQTSIQRLGENQNSVINSLIVAGSGIAGITLARKRGIFKKFLYGSSFMGIALAFCNPEQTKLTAKKALYIAQNKLPQVIKQKYDTLGSQAGSVQSKEQNKDE